ncbi:MAG: cytidylate kinase family protein [Muribaculaceae bacterium]|nr:cytidylate kinase family protein [Muribaculaceae bacterium]
MEPELRSKQEKLRRYFVFFVSLFIMSFGVSLVTRSLVGTSPISSVPYVWSINTALSMGTYIIILNAILIIAQLLMLGRKGIKESRVELLMQIPVSLLFGVFIDITMAILSSWHPTAYYQQLISCVVGCCIMALGISLEVVADVCMNSGEYVLHIASKKLKKEFGTMKIMFDVTLLLIAVGCSWIFAGRIDGVREGTIIVAILTGPMVRLIRPRLRFIDRWEEAPTKREDRLADSILVGDTKERDTYPVITIGREYGSGGHEIGELIAKELGIPFYDNSMMEMVAKETGLSEQIVRDYDQRLPHSLLFEMIVKPHSLPLDGSLSMKDALFVAQSRVIRRLASEGPCVIVGRCSDYVLKDNPDCVHIFLHASPEYKAKRAVEEYGVSAEKASAVVSQLNNVRRNHYSYYTEQTWGDPHNYHAVFDTSKLSPETIVKSVSNMVKR